MRWPFGEKQHFPHSAEEPSCLNLPHRKTASHTPHFLLLLALCSLFCWVLGSLQPGQAVIKVVQDELVALMGDSNESLNLAVKPPAVILLADERLIASAIIINSIKFLFEG